MAAMLIRKMFAYNYWAHGQVWRFIDPLTDAQFRQPSDYSVGSIHQQLVHVMGADSIWLSRLRGERPSGFFDPADYPTPESIKAKWGEIERDLKLYVAGLTDAQVLNDDLHYRRVSTGAEQVSPLWQVLLHVCNHGTDHRAQILALLHQVGGETFAQDLIYYTVELEP